MIDRFQRDYERARAAAPYGCEALVERMTRHVVDAGHSILQSHKLGRTDLEHVEALLDYFAPPMAAHVLDIGCGVGAVASLMVELRPDLSFTLFNLSPAQLAMAPICMARVSGHMHDLPFAGDTFDAAIFNFSLGHGLLDRSLGEATRVVRRGGVVFAYELSADRPSDLVKLMGYRPHRIEEVEAAGRRQGLVVRRLDQPYRFYDHECVALFGQDVFTRCGFDQCWPAVYRFLKP